MQPAPPLQTLPAEGPLTPQQAATTVIENYGLYHDVADRLSKLQQFVKDQLK